jgi:hypothetical protein
MCLIFYVQQMPFSEMTMMMMMMMMMIMITPDFE